MWLDIFSTTQKSTFKHAEFFFESLCFCVFCDCILYLSTSTFSHVTVSSWYLNFTWVINLHFLTWQNLNSMFYHRFRDWRTFCHRSNLDTTKNWTRYRLSSWSLFLATRSTCCCFYEPIKIFTAPLRRFHLLFFFWTTLNHGWFIWIFLFSFCSGYCSTRRLDVSDTGGSDVPHLTVWIFKATVCTSDDLDELLLNQLWLNFQKGLTDF